MSWKAWICYKFCFYYVFCTPACIQKLCHQVASKAAVSCPAIHIYAAATGTMPSISHIALAVNSLESYNIGDVSQHASAVVIQVTWKLMRWFTCLLLLALPYLRLLLQKSCPASPSRALPEWQSSLDNTRQCSCLYPPKISSMLLQVRPDHHISAILPALFCCQICLFRGKNVSLLFHRFLTASIVTQ